MATANPNPNTAAVKAATPTARPGLRVIARRAGFRRAGRSFSAEPTEIPLAELTREQIAQLRAEGAPGGQLVVIDIDIEPPATAAAAEG
jgi:hypothetical protein